MGYCALGLRTVVFSCLDSKCLSITNYDRDPYGRYLTVEASISPTAGFFLLRKSGKSKNCVFAAESYVWWFRFRSAQYGILRNKIQIAFYSKNYLVKSS